MSESKIDWLQRVADMHGLDPEDIEEIAEMCIEDTVENIAMIEDLSDMQTAIRAAHSIKGSAANIGQQPLSDAAKTIEASLKDGDTGSIPAKLAELNSAYQDFKTLMNL
ncbi:MAG: Hpt domain-containing protein [Lentisphaeraceae bacterium]|nr:Hpt domain-containing protein [Lentisphaeraceae bacterium]